jgi:translation initiation factor 4G
MGRGHNRGESVQSETTQAPHGRGMPAGRGNRHQGGYQQNNQYQNASYGYGGRGGYQGGNQQRNGPNNMGPNPYPQQQFPSPRVPPRSPALSHVSTHHSPSMAPAVPTTHTPQLYPPQPHGQQFMPPGGPQVVKGPFYMFDIHPLTIDQYPGQQMYDPMYGYQQYPPMYNTQFPPNTSPRPHYVSPQMGGYPPYGQQGAQPMSRTSSTNMGDIHRPPSSIGQHGQPSMAPQQQHMMVGTPPPGTPAPQPYARAGKKASKAISIKKPDGTELKIDKPAAPAPVTTPVIVSSPAAPGRASSRPEAPHSRSTSRSNKTAEEKRAEMREKVLQEAQKAEQQKAAEQDRLRKEEEEKKLKAEAEAKAKAEEEEERAKAEAEAKAKEEAEAKAKEEAEAKAKAEAEAKAKAEAEAAEKEAQEKAAKEAEEKAAKEAEEAKAKAEAEAEVAKAAEEVKADPASETPVDTPADTPTETSKAGTPDSESMPPPSLKSMEKARSKPSPLNLQLRTTEPAPPSAQLTALRSARPLENLKNLAYPEGIQSPNPALNPLANATKFKYDKEFLMQFQNVFTEKPSVDWDQRMKETVGDTESARPGSSARTPSGLGPRGSSSRGSSGMTFGGAMGSFATGPGSKPASALTSMERFKASTNPLAMMGSLTSGRPSGLVRTGSSTSSAGAQNALPQSPARASNRSARGSSKRGNAGAAPPMERTDSRGPSQPTIPLAEVKPLPVSANRWTPRSIKAAAEATAAPAAAAGGPELMSPEMVQRKVKAALNKMTPEKFDKISDQILEITGQSKHESDGRTLRQVIQLTFEKACDEAHWASMYAKFCKRMLETMDPNIKDENVKDKHGVLVTGGALFRKYLLNRCQEEFERGWKVNMPPKPEGVSDEVMMLSDEYYIAAAAKRRGLGLVQFIGELFKLNMLTERIMNECVRKLLDFEGIPEDETVESLSKLLRTIGAQLDSSEKSKPMMDLYFGRIQGMIENKELNSRMRFMLMVNYPP